MKTLLVFLLAIAMVSFSDAQVTPLSGVYTIDALGVGPQNYTTFVAAVADLNSLGISGPVAFEVASGQVFAGPISITATGTAANSITFKNANPSRTNPVIEYSGTSGTDAIVTLYSSDYITFDGIDVRPTSGSAAVEYGYLLKTDLWRPWGCEYNTIKNCTISLDKSNANSIGVYVSSLYPIWPTGRPNSYNKFINNSVQNCNNGYVLIGIDPSVYEGDEGNEIGSIGNGASTITNLGGIGRAFVAGVKAEYQSNLRVLGTNISNLIGANVYGIYLDIGGNNSSTISGNRISSLRRRWTATSAGNIAGIYISSSSSSVIESNMISDFSASDYSYMYGIYTGSGSTIIESNTITALSCNNFSDLRGIAIASGTTTNASRNLIYNLVFSGAGGGISGFSVSGGTTNNICNNMIYDLRAPGAVAFGLALLGGGTSNVYHNTVFLNDVATNANYLSASLYVSDAPTMVDVRNNIFLNTSNVSTMGLRAVAFQRTVLGFANIAGTSNNNLYYAGTPGPKNLIFYDGTNSDQTLAQYKARITTVDQAAVTENPPFLSAVPPYDLHMNASVRTQCESGGTLVSSPMVVNTDFDGDLRFGAPGYSGTGSAPDIGADEFEGLPFYQPPRISCPENITVENMTNKCTQMVEFAVLATGIPAPEVICKIGDQIVSSPFEFPVGRTEVTCTATNDAGSATCSFTVIVNDVQNPTITCPNNMIVRPTSLAGAVVTYDTPVGTDNCPVSTEQTAGLPSGSLFPIGVTTNTFVTRDGADQPVSCSFTVTVPDPHCTPGNKVNVCHNGHTICISVNALQTHLDHGDLLGPCSLGKPGEEIVEIPTHFGLDQNYPNPFNPMTTINYQLPTNNHVTLKVFDLMGSEVATLVDGVEEPGYKSVQLDASNLASGVYVYRLTAGSFVETKKLVVLR